MNRRCRLLNGKFLKSGVVKSSQFLCHVSFTIFLQKSGVPYPWLVQHPMSQAVHTTKTFSGIMIQPKQDSIHSSLSYNIYCTVLPPLILQLLDPPNCGPKPLHKPLSPPLPPQSLPLQSPTLMKPLLCKVRPNSISRAALLQQSETPGNINPRANRNTPPRTWRQSHRNPRSWG